jgi:hypothetical protein
MTGGPALSVTEERGHVTIREARLAGHGPFHGLGQNGAPQPFYSFSFLFSFSFLILFETFLQINSELIQTNFENCKIFPCCHKHNRERFDQKKQ